MSILQRESSRALHRLFVTHTSDEEVIHLDNIITLERILLNLGEFPFDTHFIEFQFGSDTGNEFFYILNGRNQGRMLDAIEEAELDDQVDYEQSDEDFFARAGSINTEDVTIRVITSEARPNGAYFNYTCKLDLDLSKFGIFKVVDKKNYKNNCLIRALKQYKLDSKKLDYVKDCCKDRKIPICDLGDIAKKINVCFEVRRTDKKKSNYYNEKCENVLKIGLYNRHFFINNEDNDIPITKYAIENYNEIKDLEKWNFIYKKREDGYYRRDSEASMRPVIFFKHLMNNKDTLLEKITVSMLHLGTQYYDKNDEITSLEYDESLCSRPIEFNSKLAEDNIGRRKLFDLSKKGRWARIYLDFEAITDGNEHTAYLCCIRNGLGDKRTFKGEYCALNFLKSIKTKNVVIIAHNLAYDCKFLTKYLSYYNWIKKGSKVMNLIGSFINKNRKMSINIIMKDSLCMIPMPLRDFGECFGLKQRKEVMPYEAYNTKTINLKEIPIECGLKYLYKKEDKEQFKKNIQDWKLETRKGYFDHIKYSELYCILDVEVLMFGYEKFSEWMLEITGLHAINYISLASLAHAYLKKEGCYEEVSELAGTPRRFIERCITGGRTMTAENKMYHVMKTLNDFDAVSLYPSGMIRLAEMIGGFLQGDPKVLNTTDYNIIKNYDGYFVEIKIINVGTRRTFPLCSEKIKDIRNFTNDFNETIHVDKITLEDLIKFQNIEFEIIRGYYFDEGRNDRVGEVMRGLFNERLKMKELKNPIQVVYKLLMNSSYGKSIMKEIETEWKFVSAKDKEGHVRKNHNWIKEYVHQAGSNHYLVKHIKPVNEHFNIAQVGTEILSMSKRIMSEVMCLAEDNGLVIYYQDTDSLHIEDKDIKTLEKLFREKYNRELIGKNIGQFHSDFSSSKYKHLKPFDQEIVSVESIFLGKKSYIDKLKIIKDGKVYYDYHVRMKGVSNIAIRRYALDEEISLFEVYKRLFYGHTYIKDGKEKQGIEFEMVFLGSEEYQMNSSIKFKMHSNNRIESLKTFPRSVKFNGEKIIKN